MLKPDSKLMTPYQVAMKLGVSTRRLANWRKMGKGPNYIKLGDTPQSQVRYLPEDVEQYIKDRSGG